MNLNQSRGIIIRNIKYSETSLILDIYSLHYGLRSYIISGVRKSKSKNSASMLQLLNIIEFSAYPTEVDKLSRIKEFHPFAKYNNLTYEILRTSVAVFMIEVVRNAIREKEENAVLYDFIEKSLLDLDNLSIKDLGLYHIDFLLQLTEHLGFFPMTNQSEQFCLFDLLNGRFVRENESSKFTVNKNQSTVLKYFFDNRKNCTLEKSLRDEVLENLLLYYKLHIPDFKELKSLSVLREVMQ